MIPFTTCIQFRCGLQVGYNENNENTLQALFPFEAFIPPEDDGTYPRNITDSSQWFRKLETWTAEEVFRYFNYINNCSMQSIAQLLYHNSVDGKTLMLFPGAEIEVYGTLKENEWEPLQEQICQLYQLLNNN